MAQSASRAIVVHTFWPVIDQPPSTRVGPRCVSDGEVAAGAGLAEHLAPAHLAPQRRRDPALLLLGGAVADDRRQHPARHLQVRAAHPGGAPAPRRSRAARAATRRGPTASASAARGSPASASVRFHSALSAARRARRRTPRTRSRIASASAGSVDAERPPVARPRPASDVEARADAGAGSSVAQRGRPLQEEVGVVLPRVADAAEHLDAVLGAPEARPSVPSARGAAATRQPGSSPPSSARGRVPHRGPGRLERARACRRSGASPPGTGRWAGRTASRVRACSAAVSTHHSATPTPSAAARTPARASTSRGDGQLPGPRHRDAGRRRPRPPVASGRSWAAPGPRRPSGRARTRCGRRRRRPAPARRRPPSRSTPRRRGPTRPGRRLPAAVIVPSSASPATPPDASDGHEVGVVAPAVDGGRDDRGREQRAGQADARRSARARPPARPRRSPGRRASSDDRQAGPAEAGQLGPPRRQLVGLGVSRTARAEARASRAASHRAAVAASSTVLVADRESGHGRHVLRERVAEQLGRVGVGDPPLLVDAGARPAAR